MGEKQATATSATRRALLRVGGAIGALARLPTFATGQFQQKRKAGA